MVVVVVVMVVVVVEVVVNNIGMRAARSVVVVDLGVAIA